MIELTLYGLAVTAFTTVCGVASRWGFVRMIDNAAGVDIEKQIAKGLTLPVAIFCGSYRLGVALFMASLWSRFI